ncbi:MAG TPA: efflux transporter outer membrane subunit [Steroidobacteraceae bacterium]|nr:efflux transporter outer membrane subunit [Steroidobacteraceae bacterium]
MHKFRTLPLAMTLAAWLGGCTVGPDFRSPQAPAVETYRAADESAGGQFDLGAPVAQAWWSVFGSADLNAVIRQSVAGNQTLAGAVASLQQAQELANAATGNRYPQVSLTAGALRQQYGAQFLGPFKLPAFTAFGAGPQVRYVLDYDGALARADENELALAQYQRYQLDAAYLALTGNVVMQVITLATTTDQIDAVQQLIAADANNLALVNTAFEAGSVSRADVLTAQSQQAADETLLPPLRQKLSLARHVLAVLAGHAPAQDRTPDFQLEKLQLPASLPVSLPSQLVHDRPDILAAEAQLHAATAAVGVATANLYPTISLSASATQQSLRPQDLFNAASSAWGLIANLTAPLYDGGTLRAERRASLAALRASSAHYQQTVLEAFGQVADLMDAMDHDAQLVRAQESALATAQNSLALARESYAAGNSGILAVLDAQRLLDQAQVGLIAAKGQRYQDSAQLLLAMGGFRP